MHDMGFRRAKIVAILMIYSSTLYKVPNVLLIMVKVTRISIALHVLHN